MTDSADNTELQEHSAVAFTHHIGHGLPDTIDTHDLVAGAEEAVWQTASY